MGHKKEIDDASFEIRFYEGILEKIPSFIEVLAALGDLYTRNGFYRQGLDMDERLYQLRPADPVILYNLACSYSLLDEKDKAFRAIKQAIHSGYDDFEHLEADNDLNNLRTDRRFTRYFERIKGKKRSEIIGT